MTTVELNINKANVYVEVAKTSSYSGAKMIDENPNAYEKIFTTDEDRMLLERFWREACNQVTDLLKPFITAVSELSESHGIDISADYTATLSLSNSYDTNLTNSIESSLFSFCTNYIIAEWYKFTNKQEASSFAKEAAAMLLDVKAKIYFKKKPTRVAPTKQ